MPDGNYNSVYKHTNIIYFTKRFFAKYSGEHGKNQGSHIRGGKKVCVLEKKSFAADDGAEMKVSPQ